MTEPLRRTWAEINLNALAHNLQTIRTITGPDCMVMAVVKADAYGHGDAQTALALQSEGADWFGVSNIEEALSLRRAGITRPILIFGYTPVQYASALITQNITQTVFSPEYARALSEAVTGDTVNVHLKVDTGMGRIGFRGDDVASQLAAAAALPGLRAEGVFTHFSVADEEDESSKSYTRAQFARFQKAVQGAQSLGTRFAIQHCCNSAGTLYYPEFHLDMVRPGVALYGVDPAGKMRDRLQLVMTLKSAISQVKQVNPGEYISYGNTYRADKPITAATLPVGYADGYFRALSNCGYAVVRGFRCPVLGRVCMDQIIIDVSSVPDISVSDEVVLFGGIRQGVTAYDLAAICGTIPYEILCAVSRRVGRLYQFDGETVAVTDYIFGDGFSDGGDFIGL